MEFTLQWFLLGLVFLGVPILVGCLRSARVVLWAGSVLCILQVVVLGFLSHLFFMEDFWGPRTTMYQMLLINMIPFVGIAITHALLIWVRYQDLSKLKHGCIVCQCGYSLHGSLDRRACPECGKPTPWAHYIDQAHAQD